MKEAVIVSTARTPIGKAYRRAFNDTESPTKGVMLLERLSNEQASPLRK